MGTRHLVMVVKDSAIKVAQYGQWDGYPEGAGDREYFPVKLLKIYSFQDFTPEAMYALGESLNK